MAMKEGSYLIRFDGGSRGNPGKAGCGYIIYKPDGTTHLNGSCFVGSQETNNVAEYTGLLRALEAISYDEKITSLTIEGDSLLVINQLSGLWKVKADNLIPLYAKTHSLLSKYEYTLSHIPRNQNKEADRLANIAMDSMSNQPSSQ
jgi:ribonuclease HI